MNPRSSEGNAQGWGCLVIVVLVFAIGGPIMLAEAIIDPSTMPDSSGPLEKIGLWLLVALIVLASWATIPYLLFKAFKARVETHPEENTTPSTESDSPRATGPTKPRREPIPKSVQMYVWQRDGGRCIECGSNENLEYDHIIPFSKGGSNTDRNLQLLCQHCNRAKGSRIG